MLAVPVDPVGEGHVVADKENSLRAELHSQIESMKPAVPAPSNRAELLDQDSVLVLAQSHMLDAPSAF